MPELDDFLGDEPERNDLQPAAVDPAATGDSVADPIDQTGADPVVDPATDHATPPATDPKAAEPTEPAEPGDVTGLKSALQAERAKRNDYKGERDRLAGELAAIKAQMEAAAKPAQAAPQAAPQPVAIPNPVEDPQGYHSFIQQSLFNDRLNMSEAMLRQHVGNDADVDAKASRFKQLAEANPALRAELQKSAHPYKFAYDTAAKAMAMDEIGDPTSFRAKLEAEIRASVMAEMAGTAPVAAPRVQLPQSLGTARSAASRNVPVVNAPESFDDILATPRK